MTHKHNGMYSIKLQFKILYNEEFHELYRSHSIILVVKTMWLQWAGHVAHVKDQ